jgi:hypothetical protein
MADDAGGVAVERAARARLGAPRAGDGHRGRIARIDSAAIGVGARTWLGLGLGLGLGWG